MTDKVDIHIAGYNDFHCDTDWTVEEARNEIRSGRGLINGEIERNGIAMRSSEKFTAGGDYQFVNFQPAPSPLAPAEIAHDWTASVFFLFVEIVNPDWGTFGVKDLKTELADRNLPVSGTKAELVNRLTAVAPPIQLEISGTAFAITARRFITCQHCIFDEGSQTVVNTVAICPSIMKHGSQIIPHPTYPLCYADLHLSNANLDYAIFNLRPAHADLTPIPVCPIAQLPSSAFRNLTCYYGAIGDFQVGELEYIRIWRGGPYPILQYGQRQGEPLDSKLLTEHGLCRGSSGGALVSNGHVVAMHLASLNQGRYMWTHVKGSTLTRAEVGKSVTDLQEIYSALKEGLVLSRVPDIMNAVNNP